MWPLSSFIATTFLLCHVLASTPVKGGCSWEVFVSGLEGEIFRDICSFSPRHDLSLLFSCRNKNRSVCIQPIKSLDVEGCEESQSASVPVVLTGTNHKALDIDLALVINVDGKLEAVDTFRVHKEMYTGNRSGIQLLNAMGKHRKTRIQITLRQVCNRTSLTPLRRKRREDKTSTADDVRIKTETSVREELNKDDVIFSGEGEQAQTTTDESVPVFDDITKELLPTVLELNMKPEKVAMKEVPDRDGDVKNQFKKVIITGSEMRKNDDLSGKVSQERSDLREDKTEIGGKVIDVNMNNTRKSFNELRKNSNKVHLKAETISLALNQNNHGSSKQNEVSVPVRKNQLSSLKTSQEHQSSSLDDLVNESLDKLQVQMRSNEQTRERLSSTSANHPTTRSSESESTVTSAVTSTLDDLTSNLPTTTSEDGLTTQKIETVTIEHTDAAALAEGPTSFSSSQDKASTHLDITTEFIEEEMTTTQKFPTTSQLRTSSDDTNVISTVKTATTTKRHDDPVDSKRVVYSATDDKPLIAQADEDTPRGVKEITDQDFLEKLMQSLRNQSNADEDIGPQTPLPFSKPEVPTTSHLSSQSTVQPAQTTTLLSQQSSLQPVQPRDVWFGRNNSKLLPSGGNSDVDGSATSPTEAVTAIPSSTTTTSTTTSDQKVFSSSAHDSSSRNATSAEPTTKEASNNENLSTMDPTISKSSTGKAKVSKEPDAATVPTSNSSRNSESSTLVPETTDTTRSSSALKNTGTTLQEEGSTTTDLNLSDSNNTSSTTEPISHNTTETESPQIKSSTKTTDTLSTSAFTPSSKSTTSATVQVSKSTKSESTASTSTPSTRPPTSTDSASSNEPSSTIESTSDTLQSSTTELSTDNTTEEVTKTLSSTSSNSETSEITTVDEVIPGHTPGPLLATSSEAKRRRFPGETGDEEEFWPIVAGLVIGIPSIIVFGIAITVIHKRRKIDTSRAFYLGGHHHRHSIDV